MDILKLKLCKQRKQRGKEEREGNKGVTAFGIMTHICVCPSAKSTHLPSFSNDFCFVDNFVLVLAMVVVTVVGMSWLTCIAKTRSESSTYKTWKERRG